MHNTAECPYCGYENDMTDDMIEFPSFDSECSECEKEFEVYVEWEPTFDTGKIEIINCENCGDETRNIYQKGKTFPFPESMENKRICQKCFLRNIEIEMEASVNV